MLDVAAPASTRVPAQPTAKNPAPAEASLWMDGCHQHTKACWWDFTEARWVCGPTR